MILKLLERDLRALASSSGGVACPGATRGVDPGSKGVIQRRFKRKKKFCDGRTHEGRTDGRTDVMVEIVV